MQLSGKWKSLVLSLAILLIVPPLWAKAPDKNDVRVLIDISGSMRKNDPDNLRRPALRMLVGLMQPSTKAGVWTFAKWTNRLVPMAEVDEAWRKSALSKSKQIASPGQFTNIERVLNDAMKDWTGEPTSHNRHIVLLTDGMVDVSKKEGESQASRQRILDKQLPQLKALGVKVHTVALSERADHALMKRLSSETGGWYQQVESADTLQRVFLKIFEQVGKPDSVPLKDNKFTVDSSIREATILVFNKPDAPQAVLVSPNGEEFSDSNLPAGVAWYRDQGYELITISSPLKGEWSVKADIDPDNRVMIVTDLKLETSALPTHLVVGEKIQVTSNLTNRGKIVTRKAFLRVLDVQADAMTSAGSDPLPLNDRGEEGDVKADDGRYSMQYGETRPFDDVELLFSVESPTFMREKRYHIAIHDPIKLEVKGVGEEAVAVVTLNKSVMRDDAKITVWQADTSGGKRDLQKNADGITYTLLDPKSGVFAQVEGQSRLGNLINQEYGPEYAQGIKPPVTEKVKEVPAVDEKVAKPIAKTNDGKTEKEKVEEPEEVVEEDNTMISIIIFVGANLGIGLIGFGVWWFMRKRSKAADQDEDTLLDEIEEISVSKEVEKTADPEEDKVQPEDSEEKAESKGKTS